LASVQPLSVSNIAIFLQFNDKFGLKSVEKVNGYGFLVEMLKLISN